MRIWIDLVNSPHVLFFLPIISRLEEEGHTIFITYRDFAQTSQLVKLNNLKAVLVNGHGGKSKLGKIKSLIQRTFKLYRLIKCENIDLALSHNSYFQLITTKLLNIPSVTSMDFEGQPANHLAFRLANLVSVPEAFPDSSLQKFGAKNVTKYPGLKEDICLSNFKQNLNYSNVIQEAFNLSDSNMLKPIIIIRPPPSLALYHNNDESLFDLLLEKLASKDLTVLILPRVKEQQIKIEKLYPSFHFSEQVLDGLQLVSHADLVVSGGGSMNREAACLNIPALSFFSGKLPAVDEYLEKQGKLTFITNKRQLDNVAFHKVNNQQNLTISTKKTALNHYFDSISSFLVKGS